MEFEIKKGVLVQLNSIDGTPYPGVFENYDEPFIQITTILNSTLFVNIDYIAYIDLKIDKTKFNKIKNKKREKYFNGNINEFKNKIVGITCIHYDQLVLIKNISLNFIEIETYRGEKTMLNKKYIQTINNLNKIDIKHFEHYCKEYKKGNDLGVVDLKTPSYID